MSDSRVGFSAGVTDWPATPSDDHAASDVVARAGLIDYGEHSTRLRPVASLIRPQAASNARGSSVTIGAGDAVRHVREAALDDREFQLLLEGAQRMTDPYAFEARFIILVAGRLGPRVGEIVHMKADWVDRRKDMIRIPRYEPCRKGKHDGVCGYCRQLAEQEAEHNDDVSYGRALQERWQPKTEAAARAIPFDFDPRAELVVERFFERYDEFPVSKTAVNRRVKRAAELADELDPDDVWPHSLRATAATFHAGRGINAIALQGMFGWAQLSTAQVYIKQSGEAVGRELKQIHSR